MSQPRAFIFAVAGTLADTERHGHRWPSPGPSTRPRWSEQVCGEPLALTGGEQRMRRYHQTHARAEKERADLDALICAARGLARLGHGREPRTAGAVKC